ncbi:ATP-binding protein [Candidatus Omnitrophota bacterium]
MFIKQIIVFCLFIILNVNNLCSAMDVACLSPFITEKEKVLLTHTNEKINSGVEETRWKHFFIETQKPRDDDSLAAEVKQLKLIIEDIMSEIKQVGLEEDFIDDLDVIFIEFGVNAVKYGVIGETAQIYYKMSEDSFEIKVANKIEPGTTFDMEQVPNPLLPENILKTSGRGIFFNKTFADKWGGTLTQLESIGEVIMHLKFPLANIMQKELLISNASKLNVVQLLQSA